MGTKKKLQKGGSISEMGYKDNSPYKYAKSLNINSPNGLITMNGVSQDLIGIDEYGNKQYMKANSGTYKFKGKNIKEYPVKQEGGELEGGFMNKAMPFMGTLTGGLDLATNWDTKNNQQKGQGIGNTAGSAIGGIFGGAMGASIGGAVGGGIGSLIGKNIKDPEPKPPYQYQSMKGIALAKQGLKLNNNINKMNLREQYSNYVSTPSGKVLNDFSQGGLVKGKSHTQGGVPTYKKMQMGGMMGGEQMPQEPEQIAEVEGQGVSEDGIAVDGGERIFSVEDTQQMEAMAQEIMSAQDEESQMQLASQLGMFVVEAISRQEEVNPSTPEPSAFDE